MSGCEHCLRLHHARSIFSILTGEAQPPYSPELVALLAGEPHPNTLLLRNVQFESLLLSFDLTIHQRPTAFLWDVEIMLSQFLFMESCNGSLGTGAGGGGLTVLELGAGTGLAGLTLARCGCTTTLTDIDADSLALCAQNAEANQIQATVCKLWWGQQAEGSGSGSVLDTYDVILACEVLHNEAHFAALLSELVARCSAQSRIYLAFEVRNAEREARFFAQASQCGLAFSAITLPAQHPDPEHHCKNGLVKFFLGRRAMIR